MARLEIHKSSIARLRPSPNAITDGSPNPVPVTVKPGFGFQRMTLQVDQESARRIARHRWVSQLAGVPVLAITLTVGYLYGKNADLVVENLALWVALIVAAFWLIIALSTSYLTPGAFPRVFSDSVRLRNVDETAAGEWRSANDPGVITVTPDTPTRDMIVKHFPPIVLTIVVAMLIVLLT